MRFTYARTFHRLHLLRLWTPTIFYFTHPHDALLLFALDTTRTRYYLHALLLVRVIIAIDRNLTGNLISITKKYFEHMCAVLR
jgi:hypothetical protein